MAEAYKCDRCQMYDSGSPVGELTIEPSFRIGLGTRSPELCKSCTEELVEFLDEPEELE